MYCVCWRALCKIGVYTPFVKSVPLEEIISIHTIQKHFTLLLQAKQSKTHSQTNGSKPKRHMLNPLPPKRHNDVIKEKIVWRRPLN